LENVGHAESTSPRLLSARQARHASRSAQIRLATFVCCSDRHGDDHTLAPRSAHRQSTMGIPFLSLPPACCFCFTNATDTHRAGAQLRRFDSPAVSGGAAMGCFRSRLRVTLSGVDYEDSRLWGKSPGDAAERASWKRYGAPGRVAAMTALVPEPTRRARRPLRHSKVMLPAPATRPCGAPPTVNTTGLTLAAPLHTHPLCTGLAGLLLGAVRSRAGATTPCPPARCLLLLVVE